MAMFDKPPLDAVSTLVPLNHLVIAEPCAPLTCQLLVQGTAVGRRHHLVLPFRVNACLCAPACGECVGELLLLSTGVA